MALVLFAISTFFLLWIVTTILKIRQQNYAFQRINEEDWHIDKPPRSIFIIQFINAMGLGCGSKCFVSFMLYVLNRTLVQPALKASLQLMKEAEEQGNIDPIVCNQNARDAMEERLQTYYNDIYNSPTLNVISKLINYAGAYQCLTNHYGLLKLFLDIDLSNEIVKEPVFIVSFPRTGTTILHRTMALDRNRFRNFDLSDMVAPLPHPVPRWDMEARKEKAKEGQALLDSIGAIFPGFAECLETMHGFRADEADEDLGWYDTGLGHMYMDPLMKLHIENRSNHDGMSKLETKDVARYRYAWLALVMKLYQHTDKVEWEKRKVSQENNDNDYTSEESPLSSQAFEGTCPTEHLPWLMKDPNHSAYLPELLKQFPDAKFIFTHRAPGDIVASMAKLFLIFTSVDFIPYAPGTTSKEWGVEANLRMKHYCNGLVDFTKSQHQSSPLSIQYVGSSALTESSSTRRIDMYFKNLVQDVPAAISNIYKQFYPDQPGPSEEAMKAFEEYLEKNAREKHGNQRRSLKDFHLTQDDVAFTEYNSLFLGENL